MTISHIPTNQLHEAAAAWRAADQVRTIFGKRQANESLHDRIADLVEEIARLRSQPAALIAKASQ